MDRGVAHALNAVGKNHDVQADDLYPVPRSFRLLGGTARVSEVETRIDASIPPQGYRLTFAPDGIRLVAADEAGARYGRMRADEVIERAGPEIPALEIDDAPDFAVRAFMLDISRDRVPTMAKIGRAHV